MRRIFRWDKKYLYWGITAFCVIACAILFFMALNYLDTLKQGIAALIRILGPFIWGLVIVYLLSPLVRFLQKKIFGPICSRDCSSSSSRNCTAALRPSSSIPRPISTP